MFDSCANKSSMLPLLALRWPSPVDGLVDGVAHLVVDQADVDGTGKRKVDGSKAATRLGATTSERWANERFRQVMLLVLEFRREWPDNSLLTDDDVQSIRLAVDNALFVATRDGHVGNIYDVNATTWAIWLVQRAHSLKAGGWVVESDEAKQRLTFEHLYRWLEGRHSLLHRHYLRDESTGKVTVVVTGGVEEASRFGATAEGVRRTRRWCENGVRIDHILGNPYYNTVP